MFRATISDYLCYYRNLKSREVSQSFKSEKIVSDFSILNTSNISSNMSLSDIFLIDVSARGINDWKMGVI